jgi:hypothetical protein
MHNVALALMRDGRWPRARKWVRRARAIDPDDPSLRRLRVKLWMHGIAQTIQGVKIRCARLWSWITPG